MDILESNYNFIEFESIDSTNEEAKRLIKDGAILNRTIIRSDEQTSGNGRRNNKWVSKEGNLYASIIVKLDIKTNEATKYSFISALAVGKTVSCFASEGNLVQYKWPNDVMVNGKKVSGILLEMLKDSKDNNWLIIGIGVNINNVPQVDDINGNCVSNCCSVTVGVKDFLTKLLINFDNQEKIWKENGFSCIRATWLKDAYKLGEDINVNLPTETFIGNFKGINQNGELEVFVNNEKRLVSSGEVFF